MSNPLSWSQIADAEPRLWELLAEVNAMCIAPGDRFCRAEVLYEDNPYLNDRLLALVGPYAPRAASARFLNTEQAFLLARDVIADALPRCFDCNCDW